MADKRTIFVLLPIGSREEAEAARKALGHASRQIVAGTIRSHTPGQELPGDVVVVGPGCPTAEQDARGQCYRVATLADLDSLDVTKATAAAEVAAEPRQQEAVPEVTVSRRELAPDEPGGAPQQQEGDDLDEMNRVELIQHAAGRWPGRERWATFGNDTLRAKIRELSAE